MTVAPRVDEGQLAGVAVVDVGRPDAREERPRRERLEVGGDVLGLRDAGP